MFFPARESPLQRYLQVVENQPEHRQAKQLGGKGVRNAGNSQTSSDDLQPPCLTRFKPSALGQSSDIR